MKKKARELASLHQGEAERKKAEERNMSWESKLIKTHLTMLLAFLTCYGPACIMIYLMNMCSICSCEAIHWLRDMHFVLVTLNSLINPFVYALRLSGFREAISFFLRPCHRCRRQEVAPYPFRETSQHVETGVTHSTGRQVSFTLAGSTTVG